MDPVPPQTVPSERLAEDLRRHIGGRESDDRLQVADDDVGSRHRSTLRKVLLMIGLANPRRRHRRSAAVLGAAGIYVVTAIIPDAGHLLDLGERRAPISAPASGLLERRTGLRPATGDPVP